MNNMKNTDTITPEEKVFLSMFKSLLKRGHITIEVNMEKEIASFGIAEYYKIYTSLCIDGEVIDCGETIIDIDF